MGFYCIVYETNLTRNIARKDRKYQDLTKTLQHHYNNVKFIHLSISTLGVFSSHSVDFTAMLKELSIDDRHLTYIQRKISIRPLISFGEEDKIFQVQTY